MKGLYNKYFIEKRICDNMKKYDVIVVGSGSGGEIVDAALGDGFSNRFT